jgi:hypothetical protein
MEFKSDSIIFTELLNIVDTYNNVYNDGIIPYLKLHMGSISKSNDTIKKNTLKMEKMDVLLDIINITKNGSFLIFANFEETLYKIEQKLLPYSIYFFNRKNSIRR